MPISSMYPDIQLPETDLFSFMFKRKDRPFPEDKVIFQDSEDLARQYTYAQIRQKAVDFGTGLKALYQFRKGDVLGLFAPNDIDCVPVILGALWAGGVVSPANPTYHVDELAFQLKDCGAKMVAVHFTALETVKKACAQVGIPETHIITLGAQRDPERKLRPWTSVVNLERSSRFRSPKMNATTDLAFLVYSSGTTGKPKGVRLTHYNMTSNMLQVQATEGGWVSWDGSSVCPGIPNAPKDQGDKILACLPFFHIYGLNLLVLCPVYTGVSALVMARFDIEKFCKLVQDHKVTFSYIVPPMVLLLCKHPAVEKYDLSSIRMLNSGAAPLTRELVENLFKRKGVRTKQGYGLSETSPTLFQQPWQEWDKTIGSTGRMVPNLQAKFCAVPGAEGESDGTKELPQGEIGELYVKGPNVFKGYHNNSAATADCLDDDGWFRTGDVGYIDKNGDLWITDRVKELIKYKGFQVAPAELEGVLADHDLIDDVAVVGVESVEQGTELPRAYIVRKGGLKAVQPEDAEKIAQWLSDKVVNYKRLRGGIRFVDAIPKSVSGKILRRILKEQAKKEVQEEEKMKRRSAKL